MSGIVGIIDTDGATVQPAMLERLIEAISYRGPDGRHTWLEDSCGLGHTLLSTTTDQPRERQPSSLEGEVWISADARVDARASLLKNLREHGRVPETDATDAELLLHAYHAWGRECLKYLIGDFAFIIWDARARSLFCARDHFGIKPFYYAQTSDALIISNTLDCVRSHPSVSDEFNNQAIGDFLLFDFNYEPATTIFRDVQRLPPAHMLTWSASEGLNIERYWRLPVDGVVHYRRSADYVEHFRELLEEAVSDRLRTTSAVVYMSGGLDSTTVAAAARSVQTKGSRAFDLCAHTTYYEHLIPDDERHYAELAAAHLGIKIHYQAADDYTLFERWDEPELHAPEPVNDPLTAIPLDGARLAAQHSRVALTGYGGDVALYFQMQPHLLSLMKERRPLRAGRNLWQYLVLHRRLPRLDLRARVNRLGGSGSAEESGYPRWLNPVFAERLELRSRWEQVYSRPSEHPSRPHAYAGLTDPMWPFYFENFDPGVSRSTVELRYPFFDLRLVKYLLAVPPVPWCINKELMRRATQGVLPEEVRTRPKTPMRADAVYERARKLGFEWLTQFEPVPELEQYVNRKALKETARDEDPQHFWTNLRPLSLNQWLCGFRAFRQKREKAECFIKV